MGNHHTHRTAPAPNRPDPDRASRPQGGETPDAADITEDRLTRRLQEINERSTDSRWRW
jgi:hypothetical protein